MSAAVSGTPASEALVENRCRLSSGRCLLEVGFGIHNLCRLSRRALHNSSWTVLFNCVEQNAFQFREVQGFAEVIISSTLNRFDPEQLILKSGHKYHLRLYSSLQVGKQVKRFVKRPFQLEDDHFNRLLLEHGIENGVWGRTRDNHGETPLCRFFDFFDSLRIRV